MGPVLVWRTERYAGFSDGSLIRWVAGASSTRGRTARLGGVAFQDGAAGRTNPQTQVTRPGFRFNAQIRTPTGMPPAGATGGGGGLAALFDPSSAATWRLVAVALAAAYVVGFHISLNGFRLGLGPGR